MNGKKETVLMCDDINCPDNSEPIALIKIAKTRADLIHISVEGTPSSVEWLSIVEELLLKKDINLKFEKGTVLSYEAVPLSEVYTDIEDTEVTLDHFDIRDEASSTEFTKEVFDGDQERVRKALEFPLLMNTYYKQGKDHKVINTAIGEQLNDIIKKNRT
jgi:hypothetical protein